MCKGGCRDNAKASAGAFSRFSHASLPTEAGASTAHGHNYPERNSDDSEDPFAPYLLQAAMSAAVFVSLRLSKLRCEEVR